MAGAEATEKELCNLKNKRRGQKAAITKRINTISRLVSEGNSRTKISYLLNKLHELFETTQQVAEKSFL